MARTNKKLAVAVEAYFTELGRLHASGGATGERSSYGPLHGLLSAVGAALKPKVHCVQEPADQGAGHPDFALYAARQVQKGRAREGQLPECGVVRAHRPAFFARFNEGEAVPYSYEPFLEAFDPALRMQLGVWYTPTEVVRYMAGGDFAVTAGWGHYGQGDAVMPGQGRAAERDFSPDECVDMGVSIYALGERTFDIHLNGESFWRNVPAAVWNYRLGGYQVLKKWLSYREHAVPGRPLQDDEVKHFMDTARRIAAILLLALTGIA